MWLCVVGGERLAEGESHAELQYRTGGCSAARLRELDFARQKQKRFSRKCHQPIWLLPHSMPRQTWISRSYSILVAGDSARATAVRNSLCCLKGVDPKAAQLVSQAATEPSHPHPGDLTLISRKVSPFSVKGNLNRLKAFCPWPRTEPPGATGVIDSLLFGIRPRVGLGKRGLRRSCFPILPTSMLCIARAQLQETG